jgi:peptide/nickel transport system substrate-binding protein
MANIRGARAVDSHLVEIRTAQPDAMLPQALSVLRIVPPRYWAATGPAEFARRPIGTGSFLVESWGSQRIVMRANPDAWRPPRVERLEFLELPDTPSRLQGMQSGALDIALRFSPDDAPALAAAGVGLVARPNGSVYGLSFITTRRSPLQDPRVRRALNMAVDRQLIVDSFFHNTTEIATQYISRHAFGYDPELEPYPYDPAAARALLREAGYPEGFSFTAEVVIGAIANDSLVFQQIAASLREIGVTMELRPIPTQLFLRNIFGGGWRGHAFGMDFGASPFLDGWRPFRMHSCLWPQPWFCDESLSPLIAAIRHEFDLDRRAELMKRLLAAYQAAAPALMVYEGRTYDGVAGHVRNYEHAFGVTNFHALELADRN